MTNPIPANDDGLTWAGHLEELRARILWAAVAFLSLVFLFYGFSDDVLRALAQSAGGLVFTSPAGAFWARWIVTFWGAFFFSLPVLCWQAWRFTSSGLNSIERRLLWWGVPLAVLFFVAGVLFAYAIAVPMAMRFLLSFSTDLIAPMITVENYVSFLGTMLFAFGVMFETPFLIFIAVKIGWVTPQGMARKRKLAVVVILIVSAIFTPPDVISQLILAIPLFFLYEAGIFAARRAFGPRKGP